MARACWSSVFTATNRPLGDACIACRVTHGGAQRCFDDSLSIGCIILLALDEWLDIDQRDQTHRMAKLLEIAAPAMGRGAQASMATTQLGCWAKNTST